MHLINDYRQQVLTDQRERDLARLAEHNRPVQLALTNRVAGGGGCWRIRTAAQRRTAQRGMAMPKRRVAR